MDTFSFAVEALAPLTTRRTVMIQVARTAAQYLMARVVLLPGVVEAADAAGADLSGAAGPLALALLLGWIALVTVLERKVHPAFGWLNGWRATAIYAGDVGQLDPIAPTDTDPEADHSE